MDICSLLRDPKIQRILKEMEERSKRMMREIAISLCNGKISTEIGDRDSVKVPACPIGSPKVVVHTHTLTPKPSTADLAQSYKQPVCILFNKKVTCYFKGKKVCSFDLK